MNKHVELLVAESELQGAGWGVFAKHPIRGGSFVAEYKGELITQEEAERRGRFYDKVRAAQSRLQSSIVDASVQVNRSYLFNLNADFVVDAFRKGNALKFANHSARPNCEPRIIMSMASHHVVRSRAVGCRALARSLTRATGRVRQAGHCGGRGAHV
jgi:histone-lysine N-methyltransferase EZH2